MNHILHHDWLPERARCRYLACLGFSGVSHKKRSVLFPYTLHVINPLLTKLVWSTWLDVVLILFFCTSMDLDSISVHKHAKKEVIESS